jgi:hypothetical protein
MLRRRFFIDFASDSTVPVQYWYLYLYWYMRRVGSRRHPAVDDHERRRAYARAEWNADVAVPEPLVDAANALFASTLERLASFHNPREGRSQPRSDEIEIRSA